MRPARAGLLAALSELSKIRLTSLVIVSVGAGYALATLREGIAFSPRAFASTVLGAFLVAVAASTFNQVWEVGPDGRMARTRHRPLVTGALPLRGALALAVACAGGGIVILHWGSERLAATLTLATLLSYVLVYTPLKRRTTLNTLVGAVPGALPPLIGWAGATGELWFAPWTLFAIIYLWQIPHFLAIAWLYRQDYVAGGFRMLAATDESGVACGRMAVLYSLALTVVSLSPTLAAMGGWLYLSGAPVLGSWLAFTAWGFWKNPSPARARRLFYASLIYLPLLLALLLVDRTSLPAPFASLVLQRG